MHPETTPTKTLSIKLDATMRERIKHLADARQRTPHWMMREAIAQYVEREERRESFRQATLNAWHEYRETGLHVSGDEADEWLAKLAEGHDVEPPPCHR